MCVYVHKICDDIYLYECLCMCEYFVHGFDQKTLFGGSNSAGLTITFLGNFSNIAASSGLFIELDSFHPGRPV